MSQQDGKFTAVNRKCPKCGSENYLPVHLPDNGPICEMYCLDCQHSETVEKEHPCRPT